MWPRTSRRPSQVVCRHSASSWTQRTEAWTSITGRCVDYTVQSSQATLAPFACVLQIPWLIWPCSLVPTCFTGLAFFQLCISSIAAPSAAKKPRVAPCPPSCSRCRSRSAQTAQSAQSPRPKSCLPSCGSTDRNSMPLHRASARSGRKMPLQRPSSLYNGKGCKTESQRHFGLTSCLFCSFHVGAVAGRWQQSCKGFAQLRTALSCYFPWTMWRQEPISQQPTMSFFVHPMNADTLSAAVAYEKQALARVRRVGQMRSEVHVWRFVTRHTVEEHIHSLHQRHQQAAGGA